MANLWCCSRAKRVRWLRVRGPVITMLAVACFPCLTLLPLQGRARAPSMVAATSTTDYLTWAADHGIVAPKLGLAPASEADERGVVATEAVSTPAHSSCTSNRLP